jgi:predicted enzyme related to lactoylglutathione lyase
MESNHITYIEFKANNLDLIKEFYTSCFDWQFTDYGPSYIAFSESGLAGGFELTTDEILNGALVVLYHHDLEEIKNRVVGAGGKISKEIFSFPGGKRFHFTDPCGNELAIWSE